jgi:hypothetical protein
LRIEDIAEADFMPLTTILRAHAARRGTPPPLSTNAAA